MPSIPISNFCQECGLDEPLDDALHFGELLCLTCAEACTCGEEIRVEEESTKLIVPTPRGKWEIKAVRHPSGVWVVDEFLPELMLMPGDTLEVEFGVVTGVHSLTDDFILEVIFHPLVEHEVAAAEVERWGKTFKVGATSPLSFCVAGPVLEALHPISKIPDVIEAELVRIPGETVDLTAQVRKEFPPLKNGD